jgi:hypothetical protein
MISNSALKKIMKKISIPILILLNVVIPCRTTGQELSQTLRDSIFISALSDELNRSIQKLEDKETGKPFFISYSMLNGIVISSNAVLGALTESASRTAGDWYLRLMMGNYERNDENFVDPFASPDVPNRIQIACPIEPDYWAIRKAFWWNTDNVFRSASRNYKTKLQALSEYPLDAETGKLPDYTKADPVKIILPDPENRVSKQTVDLLAKELSAVFRNVDGLDRSGASVTVFNSTVYMVNTEGSVISIPLNLCVANVFVQVKTDEDETLEDNITYMESRFTSLPPADTIKQASLRLAQYLLQLKNAEEIKEDYNGPVMLFNQASAEAFLSGLFGGENKLIASREPLVYNMKKSMVPDDKVSVESKMDKRIVSNDISVIVLPFLKEFNGINLLGHMRVDAEGIVPPEEILLIQNGVLKDLLSNRVPTPKIRQSNGHYRMGLRMGGFAFQMAPSVVKVTTVQNLDQSALRQQLMNLATEKGLEYVFLIKPLIISANYSPLCFYRLDINSGEEKLIKPMAQDVVTMNDLNRRIYLSTNIFVSNILFNSYSRSGSTFPDGIPVSLIVPDAVVLEELKLNASSGDFGYGSPLEE